ncbi:hypothetical protein ETH_00032700 [Eimeria tenella]|uniref:Uncharacterized protein n=1 Tax=Eimeria tenella TaxID=5802 RepID=U6L5Z6_EIMTE|nr:hypothetical protein ETH_00032700 [Eimeria tenella]CDJ43989.1 hypothetical protein ETH_00032700 [Eimeria tenella]|eukprot:XP_013234738.1 hypothetical protein ETH_00032700 [Eimeria tenella]
MPKLFNDGWEEQQKRQPLSAAAAPAAAAAAAAARPATSVNLSLFVRWQRLEFYRQPLESSRRLFPLLQQLQQAADCLKATLSEALGRLAKSRQHLLPLLQHLLELREQQQQLFKKEALCIQQLAPAATGEAAAATAAAPTRDIDAVGAAFQALLDISGQQQYSPQQQQLLQKNWKHGSEATTAAATAAAAEATVAATAQCSETSNQYAVLWEALADLHSHPTYLLQCPQQLLRLRRQLLQQQLQQQLLAEGPWGEPMRFAAGKEAPRTLTAALRWVPRAAAAEAAVFVSLLQLLYTRGGAAALGIQKQQQQQQQEKRHGFSADASDVCERSDEAAESHFPLVDQQQQQQQEQQQQQQLQPQLQQQQQVRGWLPLSDAATLPTEAGSSAATLQELLNPAALLEGSLEALHGPLPAQLAAVLDSSINSSSTSTSSCGITAFKIGLLLEQAAAAIEQAIAAAVQNSPQKRLEREQHQQQQQQQRQPLLVRFLLDLSTRVLDRLETQWDSSALLLPQLSAAAAAEWAPAAEEGAPPRSSLPPFLTAFASRLQDLLLAYAASLSSLQQPQQQFQQQPQQQQQQQPTRAVSRLETLVGRDVSRCLN